VGFGVYYGKDGPAQPPQTELLARFGSLSMARDFMVSLAEELGYFIAETPEEAE